MTRLPVLALALLLAGCSTAPPAAGPSEPGPSGPAPATGSATAGPPATGGPTDGPGGPTDGPGGATGATGAPKPAPNRSPYTVTADWTTRPVAVAHPLVAPPLRRLTEVRFGDHPRDEPGYSRVTFAFAGGFPSYDIRYVPAVEQDGSGDTLTLPGNAFVRIVFRDARAHDDAGRPAPLPPTTVGYPTLKGYAFGGDFEGYVTFGLGLQTAAGSDQTLPIRVGELVRPDGSYVVAVDVRR